MRGLRWRMASGMASGMALSLAFAFSLVLTFLNPKVSQAQTTAPTPVASQVNTTPNAQGAPVAKLQGSKTLLVLGDSLSAEYGLVKGTGWVALLEEKLNAQHMDWRVINASISGDTTSGGLARLPALLATHHPQLVVIELGANDALRGLALNMTRSNLLQMTQLSKRAQAKVLLIGMQVPPNYGRQYNEDLKATFSAVAKQTQSASVPFFFQGLLSHIDQIHESTDPTETWFQADRIHPLAKAHPYLLQGIWPTLKNALKD